MSVLTPSNSFDDVYKLETTDPVKAGTVSGALDAPTDGHTNAPLQALTNRTEYLYQRMLPIGTILMYGSPTAPTYFLVCDGSAVSRTSYSELFAIIGTRYGIGDGTTTFNLPDNRGLFPRGYSSASGNDPDASSRTAVNGGASGNNVGSVQDDAFETHTHDVDIAPAVTVGSGNIMTSRTNTGVTPESITSDATGGTETRPKNIYHQFIIKAL